MINNNIATHINIKHITYTILFLGLLSHQAYAKKHTDITIKETFNDIKVIEDLSMYSSKTPSTNEFIHPNIANEYCTDSIFSKKEIVNYINNIRVNGITCEGQYYKPVRKVRWNDKLLIAARRHSVDMAKNLFVDHKGTDGSLPDNRVNEANYNWVYLNENVASGTRSLGFTLHSFVQSKYHCNNVMSADVTEMAIACAYNPKADQGLYWTQIFSHK